MGIFKKPNETPGSVMTSAPEEPETPGEIKHIEDLNESKTQDVPVEKELVTQPQVREVPRCVSQTDINNLIIDMDVKLNYIISKIE